MECLVCGKKKKDFEVWHNKVVIAATYDSEIQDHKNIRKMNADSVICHDCMQSIINQVNESRK
jgi:RNA polymerase subunit RPABC4/transcription elongation factor Spt4